MKKNNMPEETMKSFMNAIEKRTRREILKSFEKQMNIINRYAEEDECISEMVLFAKSNLPIMHKYLSDSINELNKVNVRSFIYEWSEALLNDFSENVPQEKILSSLAALDEIEFLKSIEFFRIKDVLILLAGKEISSYINTVIDIENEKREAEAWVNDEYSKEISKDGIFFLEHAIKLSRENNDDEKESIALKRLSYIGKTENQLIEHTSQRVSDILLRLTNAVTTVHRVVNIDWMEVFKSTSHTEKVLMQDHGKVYPRMDEDSKRCIRNEIAYLSDFTRLTEHTIASAALELVNLHLFSDVTQVLYTDDGREKLLAFLNKNAKGLKKMIPDKDGRRLVFSQISLTAFLCFITGYIASAWASVILIPVLWSISWDVICCISQRIYETHPLLSLDMEKVPEENRTLVVIPALLTGKTEATEVLKRLEEHGIHESDDHIDFMLLGDFKDSNDEKEDTDDDIMKTVSSCIRKMNRTAGRRKYHYLQRARTYNQCDGRWMGRERKRGALEDLMRYIVSGENRFMKASEDESFICKYKYLLTVDSDTRILPGEIRSLIGMAAHPMNREYGVIQPRMETVSSEKRNLIRRWLNGIGGMDQYDICACEIYQHLTGEGMFSGKGIINIEKFYEKCKGAFEENTVLSHDMIEGILSKAAYAGNRVLYETFPETLDGYLKRLDRWTRGDWQLLYYAFGRMKISLLGKFKIFANVIRSLKTVSVLGAIALSIWTYEYPLLIISLLGHFMPAITGGFPEIKRTIVSFSLIPSIAWTEIRAAGTAIIRIYITKRKRLEWVTAAQCNGKTNSMNYPGILASLFLLPGIFAYQTILISIIIGLFFAFGRPILEYLIRNTQKESIDSGEYAYLSDLAKSIWKYFESYVPLEGNGIPPDNVQIDPPIGIQSRTSPTNIGMYMLSVISAYELGLIMEDEMLIRLRNTVKTLALMDKEKGLFYNWYDSKTLEPAVPRYISSVDVGNLLAAFVTARNFLYDYDIALSDNLDSMIREADVAFLYNGKRKLFRIGYDAQNKRMSASHYDLFATEARILSYVAMAEKGISLNHWKHLSRPFKYIGKEAVIKSWSGTMFEYMMPNLLIPAGSDSLMEKTMNGAVWLQKKASRNGIWGISESGYAAFDQMLNYQYRAFGIDKLSLSGETRGNVFAPYAALLALESDAISCIESLVKMEEAGLKGNMGFYEAIDLTSADKAQIVYSYMTHHQGMSFVSLANYLTNNRIRKHFMNHPKESALLPVTCEKQIVVPLRKIFQGRQNPKPYDKETGAFYKSNDEYVRGGKENLQEGHVLFTNGSIAYFTPSGQSFYRKGGIYANLWTGDTEKNDHSILPSICDESGKAKIKRSVFETGKAEYELESETIKAKCAFTLNPENGHLLIKVNVFSNTNKVTSVKIEHAFKLALADEDTIHAHPVFSDLFIKRKSLDESGIIYAKVNRSTLKEDRFLLHISDVEIEKDSDRDFADRKRAFFSKKINIRPFETFEVYFEIGLSNEGKEEPALPTKTAFERACILLRTQTNAHIEFCGLSSKEYRHADQKTNEIFSVKKTRGDLMLKPESLWPFGISGNTPILLAHVFHKSSIQNLRKLMHVSELYRYMGISLPIVIIKAHETDYFTPLTDGIEALISNSGLDRKNVHVLSKDALSKVQTATLHALAVMNIQSNFLNDTRAERKEKDCLVEIPDAVIEHIDQSCSLIDFNGFGGFQKEECCYEMLIKKDRVPKRRWSNILANPAFGAMTTDLGVSFLYFENSRNGRITPFQNINDVQSNGISLYAIENGKKLSLMPTASPKGDYRIEIKPGETVYTVKTKFTQYETACFVDPKEPVFYLKVEAKRLTDSPVRIDLIAETDFLLGVDLRDRRFTSAEKRDYVTIARGRSDFEVYSGFIADSVKDGGMKTSIVLENRNKAAAALAVGVIKDDKGYEQTIPCPDYEKALSMSRQMIYEKLNMIRIDTMNPVRDKIVNGFLKAQTLFSRYYGRFGPYQPGGAFGMRDQLQDLLSIMYFDPDLARRHIVLCASRQFEKGDALHWWHMPASGVRTRISDDILFLPMICSKYMEFTGDTAILSEKVAFLKEKAIPEERDDLYCAFEETENEEKLYDHIMKAFRHASRRGSHGLLLMGDGDWNDGMNKVGTKGNGESVWLSEFWIYTAKIFMPYANKSDQKYLKEEYILLTEAIEKHAWDGKWYIRAFHDDGTKIGASGNAECEIDLITQAWAVIAGLNKERAETAVRSAIKHLIDEKNMLIRLLDKPFTQNSRDIGYIGAYPPGIRENGGQYTHAACWLVKACSMLDMADEAWKAFDMLLPAERSKACEDLYGGEPYVIAADISYNPQNTGSCGWTWYTGAAAWAERIMIEDLLGVEICKDKARMRALMPSGLEKIACTIRRGKSEYTFTASRNAPVMEDYIELTDDGKSHVIEIGIRNKK